MKKIKKERKLKSKLRRKGFSWSFVFTKSFKTFFLLRPPFGRGRRCCRRFRVSWQMLGFLERVSDLRGGEREREFVLRLQGHLSWVGGSINLIFERVFVELIKLIKISFDEEAGASLINSRTPAQKLTASSVAGCATRRKSPIIPREPTSRSINLLRDEKRSAWEEWFAVVAKLSFDSTPKPWDVSGTFFHTHHHHPIALFSCWTPWSLRLHVFFSSLLCTIPSACHPHDSPCFGSPFRHRLCFSWFSLHL